MWQVHEAKVITLTRGGLISKRAKTGAIAVTTNDEKSAEAIVLRHPNEETNKLEGRAEL
jgi:hypothetical protein